ncbi:RAMP superfamily CRISPR-associated protein [Paratissierella segnis]|uniref:CRISPR type III-associated protein domain-containing protein n=1 Tax=Paratissierella segnis TaxID=2763679 RepID=A0A926EW39_9FIRM|nr:RAMP superfamily CRISPR-associated protein [Paratissierella segnis]MBC8587632.1 hypothetical protein [Paratissierella segnis]
MPKYITFDLIADENLKLSKTNMQVDSQDSMDYIGGSTIRGAFIYKYIRANNISNINQGEHREKLLAGGIKFLNAYPVYKDERSVPLPKCYFAPKEKIRTFEDKIEISLGLDRPLPQGFEKVRLGEYVNMDKNNFTIVNVEKTSNLHINKLEKENKLFRYEAIKKGQIFKGIIKVEKDEYADEVIKLLENKIVYIGGSKGSGYGKCIIKEINIQDGNPEKEVFKTNKDSGYIYIIALSDIIYKDECGVYKTKIDEKLVEDQLGISDVEFIDSSIETKNITSFNNKWNARTPNIVAIKAGSVFKYKFNGNIDEMRLKSFMDNAIGERKSEGFGRIGVTTEMYDNTVIEMGHDIVKNTNKTHILSNDELNLLKNMCNRIFKLRIENKINERVLELSRSLKNDKKLSSNQWGNLKNLFEYISILDINSGLSLYKEYINHIVEKKGKSFKDMEKVQYLTKDKDKNIIGRQSLIEFFNEYMENIIDRFYFENMYRDYRVNIENAENNIEDEFIYKTNLKILSELCRYQIRKEKVKC